MNSPSKAQDEPLEIILSECWDDILCRWVTERCCLQPHRSYNSSKIQCCWVGYRLIVSERCAEASLKGVECYGILTAAYWTLSTLISGFAWHYFHSQWRFLDSLLIFPVLPGFISCLLIFIHLMIDTSLFAF